MSKNVIIHGDSRNFIPRITTPIKAVITDPPYGMDFQSNRAVTPDGKALNRKIEGDQTPEEAIKAFHSIMARIIPKLADEAEIYVFTAWHVLDTWIPAVKALNHLEPNLNDLAHVGEADDAKGFFLNGAGNGIELKMMLFWEKGYPGQGDLVANWGCGHEVCLYLKKGRRPIPSRRSGILHIAGDINSEIKWMEWYLQHLKDIRDGIITPSPTELGYIPVDKVPAGQNVHPTEKPVALIEKLVEMSTNPGDLIVDPYSGSGSTSVAAQRLGRDSLAFDIDAKYVQVGKKRLEQVGFTF